LPAEAHELAFRSIAWVMRAGTAWGFEDVAALNCFRFGLRGGAEVPVSARSEVRMRRELRSIRDWSFHNPSTQQIEFNSKLRSKNRN